VKKAALVAAMVVGLYLALGGGEALATICINAAKPNGAGNIGNVVINAATGQPSSIPTNPGGQVAGGFVDVYLDVNSDGSGDVLLADDVFLLNTGRPGAGNPALRYPPELPAGAHNAGPGDEPCDGIGVDDAEHC